MNPVFLPKERAKKEVFLCKRISAFQINTNLGQNLKKNRNSEIMNKFNEAKMVGKKVFLMDLLSFIFAELFFVEKSISL